jgi:hypothetical protein
MDKLAEKEKIKSINVYEEMKDISNVNSILRIKQELFSQKNFQLRKLFLTNLKELIIKQLKAIDETYNLAGIDKELWLEEESILHEIEVSQINIQGENKEEMINKLRRQSYLKNLEAKWINSLTDLIKEYFVLLYEQLKSITNENILLFKELLLKEEKLVEKIVLIIELEKSEKNE